MDLEERIARVIDPRWEEHPDAATTPAFQRTALTAARRVIDGLNLDITTIMGHAGPITGIITGHIDPKEDA